MEKKRIQLAVPIETRDSTLSQDAELVNLYTEESPIGIQAVKRPGMGSAGNIYPNGSSCTGQGAFIFNGLPVFVACDTLIVAPVPLTTNNTGISLSANLSVSLSSSLSNSASQFGSQTWYRRVTDKFRYVNGGQTYFRPTVEEAGYVYALELSTTLPGVYGLIVSLISVTFVGNWQTRWETTTIPTGVEITVIQVTDISDSFSFSIIPGEIGYNTQIWGGRFSGLANTGVFASTDLVSASETTYSVTSSGLATFTGSAAYDNSAKRLWQYNGSYLVGIDVRNPSSFVVSNNGSETTRRLLIDTNGGTNDLYSISYGAVIHKHNKTTGAISLTVNGSSLLPELSSSQIVDAEFDKYGKLWFTTLKFSNVTTGSNSRNIYVYSPNDGTVTKVFTYSANLAGLAWSALDEKMWVYALDGKLLGIDPVSYTTSSIITVPYTSTNLESLAQLRFDRFRNGLWIQDSGRLTLIGIQSSSTLKDYINALYCFYPSPIDFDELGNVYFTAKGANNDQVVLQKISVI